MIRGDRAFRLGILFPPTQAGDETVDHLGIVEGFADRAGSAPVRFSEVRQSRSSSTPKQTSAGWSFCQGADGGVCHDFRPRSSRSGVMLPAY